MSTNLVSLVMEFLTPEMIGRIATALELDRNKVPSAFRSAVPALLAAFSDTPLNQVAHKSSPMRQGSRTVL